MVQLEIILWKESLNSDSQQFQQFKKKEKRKKKQKTSSNLSHDTIEHKEYVCT